MHRQCASLCKGATIRYGGGGGVEFLPGHIYLFHKGDGIKALFFHLGSG